MKIETYSNMEFANRRTFLKHFPAGAAGLALISPVMTGCSSNFQGVSAKERRLSPKTGGSTVFFVTGTDTRETTYQSLKPLEKEVEKAIGDKQVIIKPNVGQVKKEWWLNASNADQLRGILDFLKPIYDRKILIGDGTAVGAVSTFVGYENFNFMPIEREYNVQFIDMNDQPTTVKWIQDGNHHPRPINLIDHYLNPDIYMISAARFKNSGGVIVTLSLKNIVMGSPMNHFRQKARRGRNEKGLMHAKTPNVPGNNHRALSYNIFLVASMGVQPDLAVIDGTIGMEGNGPVKGTPIEHGVAVASTDWLAADRLASELMGYDYAELRYLNWCGQAGMGIDDLSKIKIIGPDYKKHIVQYKRANNFERQRAWIYEDSEIDVD